MRIGLVGTPGSGKTALAESLKIALQSLDQEGFENVAVVDNYVEDLQSEVDLALGFFGTYIGNLHVALKRESEERLAAKDNDVVITCGTLFETSSYSVQFMQGDLDLIPKNNDEAKYDLLIRIEAMTRVLACLYVDTFKYDYIFYLPPFEEIKDTRITELEKNLQAAFNGFNLYPITKLFVEGNTLLEVTENRLKIVLEEVLNANQTEGQNVQVEESDGSGVRSGSEDGEEQATA